MHLILISAAEIGCAWDGEEQGWVRAALLPLRMLSGPTQHFQSTVFEAWQLKIGAQLVDGKGLELVSFLMSKDFHNHFSLHI